MVNESIDKCPICKRDVVVYSYTDNHVNCEEHYGCVVCGYTYEFAYGAYREIIGGFEYIYDYTTEITDSDVDIAYHYMKEMWVNGTMTFKGMLQMIFQKSYKPQWYLDIPWYKRFPIWRNTYANPWVVIKMYIKSKGDETK